MEAEMQIRQVRRLAQDLEQCERKLSSAVGRLDALCENRSDQPIEKKLLSQSGFLKKQARLCKDMAAVLEQAGALFEKTEETVIQAAEADVVRQEETPRTVSLLESVYIPVTLT